MRTPEGVLVISADDGIRRRMLEAVGRAGHGAFGVSTVAQAGGRQGRVDAGVVVLDRDAWESGGHSLVREDGPRVLMVADPAAMRRKLVFEEQGIERMLSMPVSDLEVFLAIDEVLESERRQPASKGRRSSPGAAAPVPETRTGRESSSHEVAEAVHKLANTLRAGKAKLSNISPVTIELQGVVGDPNSGVDDVIARVERDPKLVAELLRAANSAAYRGMPKVLDLGEAGRRLGIRRLGEIAQREALRGAFRSHHKGWARVLGRMWRNTVVTAEAARTLAERMELRNLGAIYTMGLFVDIGQVLVVDLARGLGWSPPPDGFPRGQLARELKGRHAELGTLLLKSWELPTSMLAIALHHHDPEKLPSGTPVARHAWLLSGISSAVAAGGFEHWEGEYGGPDPKLAAAALGVPTEWLMEAVEGAMNDWHDE